MKRATLILALVLAKNWGSPPPAEARGFYYGCGFGGPCYRAGPCMGFFLSGTHLGFGPGYPGLFPAWSPYGCGGVCPDLMGPPYWDPAVIVMILHIPRHQGAIAASSPDHSGFKAGASDAERRREATVSRESGRPVPELDIDLNSLSGTGGYTRSLYYQGKFHPASATTDISSMPPSAIFVWQHTD